MDDHVITCDVDFGSAGPVFAVKGSPSHESDSGCSDMSDDRSVSPALDIGEIGFPELEEYSSAALSSDVDEELQSYLHSPLKRSSSRHERPAVTTVSSSPEMDFESDPDYEPSRLLKAARIPIVHTPSRSKYIPTPAPKTDICVLPQKSPMKDSKQAIEGSRPTVKVLKVIKTPVAASQDELGSQLIQALEERNLKNAKQAKINREKKKQYIRSLEDEIDGLKAENFALKEYQKNFSKEKKALEEEVDYLKSVLANQSALSGILQNIGKVKGVKLSSSLTRKRQVDFDHDYHSTGKKRKVEKSGICLHVDDGNVSLEFCSKCAKMAKATESTSESVDNS